MELIDHPEPIRLLRGDRLAGHQHLERLAGWKETREHHWRTPAGREPNHRLRLTEGCVFGGNDEVGALRHFGASAISDAIHRGEDGLAKLAQRVKRAVEILTLPQPILFRHGVSLAQIAADRECPLTGAGD